ncbi:MAG TPA: hypothetical protein VKD91_08795 [Pyrinomonadaceae bacterium]|nr:hypothetical protein [Pyrinomonadaceae bacterium]
MKIGIKERLQIQHHWLQFSALLFAGLFILFSYVACARQTASKSADTKAATELASTECLSAAKKVLGPEAEVAKCGRLTEGSELESVAFIRLKQFAEGPDGIAVSRLVILQKVDSQWNLALDAAREIQNPTGYIGIDYIDDSQQYPGYRASFSDRRSDDKAAFDLELSYLNPDGTTEGIATEISWNSATKRFQEFSVNRIPEGFQTELRNPPHIHSGKN